MSGIDFMTIVRWGGHEDGGVLIGKVYGHLSNEHTQAQAARLSFGPTIERSQGRPTNERDWSATQSREKESIFCGASRRGARAGLFFPGHTRDGTLFRRF